jgi:hypothetical protein
MAKCNQMVARAHHLKVMNQLLGHQKNEEEVERVTQIKNSIVNMKDVVKAIPELSIYIAIN